MSNIPNPPAFPQIIGTIGENMQGMGLRDYFAIRATKEDIERFQKKVFKGSVGAFPKYSKEVARYLFADAMLEARLQLPPEESKK